MRVGSRVYLYTVLGAIAEYEDKVRLALPDDHTIRLLGMPIPPSLNCAYANAKKGRVLTTDALAWQYECNAWAADNIRDLVALRDLGARKIPLAAEALFYFPNSALFTKAGAPKPLDPPNFAKLLFDQLATYAAMDDTLFFRTTFDKLTAPGSAPKRYVDVKVWIR